MGLELALETYNITFEWISGAWNKAADCLSRLVELQQDRQAAVQMLSATNHDGPAFHTEVELHNVTTQKILLYTLRQIKLHRYS